jgi:hypothetical protein
MRQVYRNFVQSHHAQAILRLLISEGRRLPKLRAYYHSEVAARGNAALRRIAEIGVARGEFAIELNDHFSHVLLGPLVATMFWQLLFADIEPIDVEQLCETHVKMALAGLLCRAGD